MMVLLPILHRLAVEVETTPACQLSHTGLGHRRDLVQVQHPICKDFLDLELVLGSLRGKYCPGLFQGTSSARDF